MLKNYEEMQKALQELLENNNDTTSVEKIARLSQMLDDSKAEREKFDEEHKEVVDKYIDIVKHTTFSKSSNKEDDDTNTQKDLIEIIKEKSKWDYQSKL